MTADAIPDVVVFAATLLVNRGRAVDLEPHQARNAIRNTATKHAVARAFYEVACERCRGDRLAAEAVHRAYLMLRSYQASLLLRGGGR